MTQWAKGLVTKADGLSSAPETRVVGGNSFLQVVH